MKLTQQQIDHIVALERQGRITPAEVLADARQPTSPLHDLYNWDMAVAAEAHWLNHTRRILKCVRVVVHTTTMSFKIPNYVRDPDVAGREQGYISLGAVHTDPALSRRALIAEFERVSSSLKRARRLAFGLDLEAEVDGLLASVVGLRARLAKQDDDASVGSDETATEASA
jgi:hypothetical protein